MANLKENNLFKKGKPISVRPSNIAVELLKSIKDTIPGINDNADALEYIIEATATALAAEEKLTMRGLDLLGILQDYKRLNKRATDTLDG